MTRLTIPPRTDMGAEGLGRFVVVVALINQFLHAVIVV